MSPHYRNLLDPGKFLGAQDFLPEREVTISRVIREKLPAREGEPEASAPMLYVLTKTGTEYARPLKLPKSVLYGLSLLLGSETNAWIGKKITPFAATCMAFGAEEECVRVRFPADIERKIRQWLKKRKVNPKAYLLDEIVPPTTDTDDQQAAGTGTP